MVGGTPGIEAIGRRWRAKDARAARAVQVERSHLVLVLARLRVAFTVAGAPVVAVGEKNGVAGGTPALEEFVAELTDVATLANGLRGVRGVRAEGGVRPGGVRPCGVRPGGVRLRVDETPLCLGVAPLEWASWVGGEWTGAESGVCGLGGADM